MPTTQPIRPMKRNHTRQQTWQWVRKQTQIQPIKKDFIHKKPTTAIPYNSQHTKKIWVQKTLLKAQGYYQGYTSIWIPKHTICTTSVSQKHEPKEPTNQNPTKSLTKMNQPTLYMWQKKDNLTTAKKVIRMENNQNKEPKKQVWVRKAQSKPKS